MNKERTNYVFLLCCLQKELNSKTSVIELTNLDRGESYCFYVQAYIPSRSIDKQLGEPSQTQCSNDDGNSIFEGEVSWVLERLQAEKMWAWKRFNHIIPQCTNVPT